MKLLRRLFTLGDPLWWWILVVAGIAVGFFLSGCTTDVETDHGRVTLRDRDVKKKRVSRRVLEEWNTEHPMVHCETWGLCCQHGWRSVRVLEDGEYVTRRRYEYFCGMHNDCPGIRRETHRHTKGDNILQYDLIDGGMVTSKLEPFEDIDTIFRGPCER